MGKLLDKVNTPLDLKGLSIDELGTLCAELREYMVQCCAINPGHLGSSLGAVEMIVGLHYVYDTPSDKIVFDVGHQAYAHKILTGRKEAFSSCRTHEGISGFPKISESPYDAFGVGHSSTSISAALGLAEAARLQGKPDKSVAIIGDGALTGGLALEGLNNAGDSLADILVIINDNNQSIDSNIGALHKHLLNITTNPAYNKIKDKVWHTIGEGNFRSFIQRWTRGWKSYLVKKTGGDLFESLGFRYFGPINGNDIGEVVRTLQKLRGLGGPRILHCITTKGKGYAPAEADPTTWHAPGRFNPETGERIVSQHKADRYQDVFGEVLVQLAQQDPRVVGITPAMATGCGMNRLAAQIPERFFDVGIEEEHAVTFSAGLAAGGMRPFCNIYSAFSQRAYDQIIHDVALQKLPVVLCFDRAGLVGEDGATHQGAFDLAAYRNIPGAIISAPSDEIELKRLMFTALQENKGPFIIRYPRGMGEGKPWREAAYETLPVGIGEKVAEGEKIAVLVLGPFVTAAVKAAEKIKETKGISPAIYNIRYLKPLDEQLLEEVFRDYGTVLTVEDGVLKGGLNGAVCEWAAAKRLKNDIYGIGIPDEFVEQDSQKNQRAAYGLDIEGICNFFEKHL